jgi:hypothetical protein
MKFFFIHILLKDLSFMVIYFILMKYNLTNETYLPSTISNFPGAPTITFWNMITAAISCNLIPLIFSFISYFFIVKLFDSICHSKKVTRILLTGFTLSLTTPILYFVMSNYHHNDYYLLKAEGISWGISFLISITTYYFFNRKRKAGEYIIA